MKKTLAAVACLVAVLGILAPPVFAQAPAPKVTITGLFDQVLSTGRNFYDGNYTRYGDHEFYARTRFRPDFTFEVGRTKAVMGIELDVNYGGTTPNPGGGQIFGPGKSVSCAGSCAGSFGPQPGAHPGDTADSGLNNDVAGIMELKWMYTEFDLTGKDSLLPFVPLPTVARLGLQPFATLFDYRYSVFANGDFAGGSAVTTVAPNIKNNLAFIQIENELATTRSPFYTTLGAGGGALPAGTNDRYSRIDRGFDFAVIESPEITIFKGLDIKPEYAYTQLSGTTQVTTRRSVNNIRTQGGNVAAAGAYAFVPCAGCSVDPNGNSSLVENRHTIGMQARLRSGPFSLDPAILYQFGSRQNVDISTTTNAPHMVTADMSSFLVDIQGGWQLGPLLLEGRAIYSPGNKARDNLSQSVRYFEPLDEDSSYFSGWAQIWALGIDYFNGLGSQNGGMGTNVGYDRYGRAQFAVRATYSMTPALDLWAIASPTWTAEPVDTNQGMAAGNRVYLDGPIKGRSSYLGTEGDLGLTWRFAPNTTFDLVGGYLFAGDALSAGEMQNGVLVHKDQKDAWTSAARVRLAF